MTLTISLTSEQIQLVLDVMRRAAREAQSVEHSDRITEAANLIEETATGQEWAIRYGVSAW